MNQNKSKNLVLKDKIRFNSKELTENVDNASIRKLWGFLAIFSKYIFCLRNLPDRIRVYNEFRICLKSVNVDLKQIELKHF